MSDDRGIRESWDANAAAWTHMVRNHRSESRRLVTDRAIVGAVTGSTRGQVLDVGCGEGWLARELAGLGFDVTGIDGSRDLVNAAAQLGGARFLHITFEQLVTDPCAAGAEFDVALFNFSLLGENIVDVLRAAHSAVRSGGRLFIQTIHPFNDIAGPYVDEWRTESFDAFAGEWNPMPWYFRTMSTWLNDVTAAGWHVVSEKEPTHPRTGAPVSRLIEATRAALSS